MTDDEFNLIHDQLTANARRAKRALEKATPRTLEAHDNESWELRKTLINEKRMADQAIDILERTAG